MNYCSNCGAELQPGARFCAQCAAPIGAVSGSSGRTPEQDLARAALTAQKVQLFAYLGAGIGAVVGFVAPAMLLYDSLGQSSPVL